MATIQVETIPMRHQKLDRTIFSARHIKSNWDSKRKKRRNNDVKEKEKKEKM